MPRFSSALIARAAGLRIADPADATWRVEATGDTAEVTIYGSIGKWRDVEGDLAEEIRGIDASHIDLRINSGGGDYFDSVAIYGALVEHRADVTAYVDGLAASGASLILQAADVRKAAKPSQVMIHDAWGLTMGNAQDHTEAAEVLDAISDSYAGVLADRAGGTTESWRELLRAEKWYSAAAAKAAGLIDEVIDNKSPGGDSEARATSTREAAIRARHHEVMRG